MNGMYAAATSTSTTARINDSVSMAGSLRGLPDRVPQGSIQSCGEERGEAFLEQARVVAVLGLAAGDQLHRVGRRQGVGERAEHEVNAPYQLLERALPQMPREELVWRIHFMFGTLAYTLAATDTVQLIAGCKPEDRYDARLLEERLAAFLTAGLNAPLKNTIRKAA